MSPAHILSGLDRVIREIESFPGDRRRPPLAAPVTLRLSEAIPLLADLAASTRGLLTRQLLRAMGFDEQRLGVWRLEHKLLQALVFRHYAPDSLPLTAGLDSLTSGVDRERIRQSLRRHFPSGFVVKTALGDCSGNDIDRRTEAAVQWIESGGRPTTPSPQALIDEEFIVQERIPVVQEYRVHTVEDMVIDDLTVRRHYGAVRPGERVEPNTYVQAILDTLPAGLTSGAVLAWDVARTPAETCIVIEVNVGGIHRVYNPGFHSSGYYHHKHYGAVYSARLLRFVERSYACRIEIIADAPGYFDENSFYKDVTEWKECF